MLLIGRLFSPWDPAAGLGCLSMQLSDLLRLILALLQARLLTRLTQEGAERPHDLTWVYLILSIALCWLLRLQQNGANAFIYFQF